MSQIKNHIIKLLSSDTRLDGRKPLDYRSPVTVEYGVIKTAEGSAKVTIGETQVMAGIKLSVGVPYPDTPEEGCLMVGVELLPMSNPEFELGPPSIYAIELSRVVDRGIRESHAIDVKKLCIRKGELVWMVSVDICPINDAGNMFDACALAAIAALKDTKLPKIEDDKVNYKEKSDESLPLAKLPLSCTVHKIGDKFIVDPTTEEQDVVDARMTIATIEDGTLCALQKGGDVPLTVDEIDQMFKIGIEKADMLRKAL